MESALRDKLEYSAVVLGALLETFELAGISVDKFGVVAFDAKEYQYCDDEKVREILQELTELFTQ